MYHNLLNLVSLYILYYLSYVYETCLLATFDVQNGTLEVKKTTGEVCFSCYFVNGSQTQGCFVKYKCLRTDFNGNTTIMKISVDTRNATKCVIGIHSSVYTVTFYDLDYNNLIYEDDFAVKLTHQSVNYLSSMSSVPLSSPSLTTPCVDCDSSKLLCYCHCIFHLYCSWN